jgi:predicted O-methyltransferase YrrM
MKRFSFPKILSKLLSQTLQHFHEDSAGLYPSQSARLEQMKLLSVLQQRATSDSADYIYDNLGDAVIFPAREGLRDFAIGQAGTDGLFAEFGVYDGASINRFASLVQDKGVKIYGFDSFEGLSENWRGTPIGRGHFNRGGHPPAVADNVILVKGWFDRSVPEFLKTNPQPFSFIHFDCDTYEAANAVLTLLPGRLQRGAIVVFDEYLNYPGWRHGEWKAWQEFVARTNLTYRYIGFSLTQAAIRITDATAGG